MMSRYLVLLIFLVSCGHNNKTDAQQNPLSILISSDSAIIYQGKLDKNTAFQKIAIEETKLKEILTDKIKHSEIDLKVLLKLSDEPSGAGGMLGQISNIQQWLRESGLHHFILADADAMDLAVFNIKGLTWSYLDSLYSTHLDLNMPREELKRQVVVDSPKETATTPIADSNVVNCILISSDSIYCYPGTDLQKGVFYAISGTNEYRVYIQQIKKARGKDLVVIIKPTMQSSYKTTVDVLDEMAINGIKNYAMVKLSSTEKAFLRKDDFNWEPPELVSVTPPGSVKTQYLPTNNAILIELKKDQSVWYTIFATGFDSFPKQVKNPVTKNLKTVIADFEKKLPDVKKDYLVKGDKNASYSTFEQVIEALKQNNVYKYNLVTSEQ